MLLDSFLKIKKPISFIITELPTDIVSTYVNLFHNIQIIKYAELDGVYSIFPSTYLCEQYVHDANVKTNNCCIFVVDKIYSFVKNYYIIDETDELNMLSKMNLRRYKTYAIAANNVDITFTKLTAAMIDFYAGKYNHKYYLNTIWNKFPSDIKDANIATYKKLEKLSEKINYYRPLMMYCLSLYKIKIPPNSSKFI